MDNTKIMFWYHYNVVETRKRRKPCVGLFIKGQYMLVDNIECNVPVKGVFRTGMQPNWVMQGEVEQTKFEIKNNIAYIG